MKTAKPGAGRVLLPCYALRIDKWYAAEEAPEEFEQVYGFVATSAR